MASEGNADAPIVDATSVQNDAQIETKPADDTATKNTEQTEKPTDSVKEEAPADNNSKTKPNEAQNDLEAPQGGEKRSLDETEATLAGNDTSVKKQKTADSKSVKPATTKSASAAEPSTNGQKKKAGRPKKGARVTERKIPPRPTDGIGSRTRSRAKQAE